MWDTIIFYMEVRGWPKAFGMGHRKHLLQLSLRFPLKGPRRDFLYLCSVGILIHDLRPSMGSHDFSCTFLALTAVLVTDTITSLPPSLLPSFFLFVQPYLKNDINCFYLSVAGGENSINLTDRIARSLKTLIICTQCDQMS